MVKPCQNPSKILESQSQKFRGHRFWPGGCGHPPGKISVDFWMPLRPLVPKTCEIIWPRGERHLEKKRSQSTASGPQGKAPPKDSLERYSQNLCRSRRPLLWQGRPPKTKRSQLDDVWRESRRSRSTAPGPQREPPGSCSSRRRAAAALARPRFSLFWRRAPAPNKI